MIKYYEIGISFLFAILLAKVATVTDGGVHRFFVLAAHLSLGVTAGIVALEFWVRYRLYKGILNK